MSESKPPTITVRGTALLRAEPDEAELLITLQALAPGPGEAISNVSERSRALAVMLDELAVAASDRSSAGITVHEEFDHTAEGRRSLGHRAISTVALRLTDLEMIGVVISRASTELAAQISGPRWEIAQDNPVRLEVARQAAADGRRRADAYAQGVGGRLGALVELAEPDISGHGMIRTAGRVGKDIPVDIGDQEVTAAIDVTFALETD